MGWSLLLQPIDRQRVAIGPVGPVVSRGLRQHVSEDTSEPGPFCSGPARFVVRSILDRLVVHRSDYASNPDSSAMT
ncbi:hypothetical protein HQO90_00955 [Rhodococcus fascians]|jgi:hypothetical protein|nr:hypothetical protein [Rhodococcus fascians]